MVLFLFVIKKGKRPYDLIPFFLIIVTFFKNISILIITSLAIHYSQNVFPWFFYLVVHRGTGVFFVTFLFFTPPARDSLSRSPRTCLRLTKRSRKIAPVLQIQASSMKLRVHGILFLLFFHINMDGKKKTFFLITTSTFR